MDSYVSPFTSQQARKPGLLSRWSKKLARGHAAVELSNLFAASALAAISARDVIKVFQKHGVDSSDLRLEVSLGLYIEAFQRFIEDHELATEEQDYLRGLANRLCILPEHTREIHHRHGPAFVRHAFARALQEPPISKEDSERISALCRFLGMPEGQISCLYQEARQTVIDERFSAAAADSVLTPDEERELGALAEKLGVQPSKTHSRAEIERMRLFGRIFEGSLPTCEVSIRLQRNETCYAELPCGWHELRKEVSAVSYGGLNTRIRLAKGVYFTAGHIGLKRVSCDVMRHIDDGVAYLTNKRLLFVGAKGNKNIRYQKILDIVPHSDGIQVEKDSGKSPFLRLHADVPLVSALFARLLDESIA